MTSAAGRGRTGNCVPDPHAEPEGTPGHSKGDERSSEPHHWLLSFDDHFAQLTGPTLEVAQTALGDWLVCPASHRC
jgi:hypothetical protein